MSQTTIVINRCSGVAQAGAKSAYWLNPALECMEYVKKSVMANHDRTGQLTKHLGKNLDVSKIPCANVVITIKCQKYYENRKF